ncbi:MAG: hypothetical protein ABIC91_02630 [Nanoarchaeota archaeon]|nr:hypothetical protein [Nanoarchaeota archaeon]MBU1029847.1 hypothetical protein [Nanoarchaeota archaeon]
MKLQNIFYLLLFIVLFSSVSAQDFVISNSDDWRDVYSVQVYANLIGSEGRFLVGKEHSAIITYSIPETKTIQIISSTVNPYIIGYDAFLEGQGYASVEELSFNNVNLELARRLPGINKFIIVDDSYGYNALAVAPYAAVDDYYVLFVDDRSIARVLDFFSERSVEDIIIFGQVDREVKDALTSYAPESINLGDRFENNIEIVKKYLEIKPTKQAILTNGEFIESSLMSGFDPVLFIGRANVPDIVQQFLQESGIDIGILIGNELINTATVIRRQAGISVFVKFAQGSRVPQGGISKVEDLDRFPMPAYILDLKIFSVFYNRATGLLELTIQNNAELASYFKSTITIFSGDEVKTVGDESPIFIDSEEYKTVTYPLQLLSDENISAELFIVYGESKKSLENIIRGTFPVESITIMDESLINITGVYYDMVQNAFIVEVENLGTMGAYVDVELIDLWVNGEFLTVGGDEIIFVEPKKSGQIKVSVDLTEEDIVHRNNEYVFVRVLYGERENSLIKSAQSQFLFKVKQADYFFYILIAVVVLMFFLIVWKRRKKKNN